MALLWLKPAQPAKHLGICLDERLSWAGQVAAVVKKVSYKLRVLRHIRPDITRAQSLPYYTALLLSDILYASNAYFASLSTSLKQILIRLDKRCIRCITTQPSRAHTMQLYAQLSICPAVERADCKLWLLVHRILHGNVSLLLKSRLEYNSLPRATRGQDACNLPLPNIRSTSGSHRPVFAAAKLWNLLP